MAQVISKDQAMREGELAVIDYLNGGLQDTFDDVNNNITDANKRITDEVTRATTQENSIDSKITAEATARETADTQLTNDISNKVRELKTNINDVSTSISTLNKNLKADINTEENARQKADDKINDTLAHKVDGIIYDDILITGTTIPAGGKVNKQTSIILGDVHLANSIIIGEALDNWGGDTHKILDVEVSNETYNSKNMNENIIYTITNNNTTDTVGSIRVIFVLFHRF